jgi:2-haloacid dehalogenase
MNPRALGQIRALAFDVFGTVVDWRGSVIRDGEELTRRNGVKTDWGVLADAWRGEYAPSMKPIREGARPWVSLDTLHYENLLATVKRLGVEGLGEQHLRWLNSRGIASTRGPMPRKESPA